MCHDYHGLQWKKKIFSFSWQNLTFNTHCGSFDCVFTHLIWEKKTIDACFNSFNHTKGILKHHGFLWNFEYLNAIAYSQK
jgi:hypothetical protein